jgi:hypothetical protein
MSDIKREQFGSLCLALESEESRTGALGAIRALIEAKVLEPDGETRNHTEGRPGGNAERGQRQQEVARYRRPLGPIQLVAGARNQHYLQLWRPAA